MQYTPSILTMTTLISVWLLAIISLITGSNVLYPLVMMIVCVVYMILDAIIDQAHETMQTAFILAIGTFVSIALILYGISNGDQSIYSLAVPILFLGINIYLLRESFLYG